MYRQVCNSCVVTANLCAHQRLVLLHQDSLRCFLPTSCSVAGEFACMPHEHCYKEHIMIRSSNVWLPEPRSYTAGSLGTLHTGTPTFFTCLHAIALVAFTMFTNSYEVFTSVRVTSQIVVRGTCFSGVDSPHDIGDRSAGVSPNE